MRMASSRNPGLMRITALTAAVLLTASSHQPRDQGPTAILGWWHGTSTCVRAPWNSACNDEEILYEFVPGSGNSAHTLLHASKLVGGGFVPMYDLAFTYSPDSSTWGGDFANARVNIQWTYRLRGDTLIGKVVLRPDMRVGRNVVAWRGRGRVP